jgi:hypothetical protein
MANQENGEERGIGRLAQLARKRPRVRPRAEFQTLPSLQIVLQSMNETQLSLIARALGLSQQGKPETWSAAELLPRLRSQEYFRNLYESLDDECKQALRFVAVHGGCIEPCELLEREFQSQTPAYASTVERLKRLSLLAEGVLDMPEPATVLFIPEDFLPLLNLPPHLEGFLGEILRTQSDEVLNDVAKRVLGTTKFYETRRALAMRLRRILLDPVEILALLGTLNDIEHEIFRLLSDRRGFALYKDLMENITSKKIDHTRAEILNGLLYGSGLAFVVAEGHNKHMNLASIPRDIFWIISNGFRNDHRAMKEIDLLSTPILASERLDIQDNCGRVMRDLAVFAGKIDVHRVRKLAAGGINRIELKKLHEVIAPKKSINYMEMMAQFLIERKHLFDINGRWRASDALHSKLEDSRGTWADYYSWWLSTTGWAEDLAERIQWGPDAQAADAVAILQLRKIILDALSKASLDNWINLSAFYESVAPQIENLLPQNPWGAGSKRLILRDVFENILAESLHWLGLIILGRSSDQEDSEADAYQSNGKKPLRAKAGKKTTNATSGSGSSSQGTAISAFQLSGLARSLFSSGFLNHPKGFLDSGESLESPYLRFDARWLIVQPTLEITAPPDLNLQILYDLSRWCTVKNVDVMTTLELTKESVRLALDAGLRISELHELLQTCSRMPVPETVRHFLEECSSRHGEVQVHAASGYITIEDKQLLEALKQHPRLSSVVKQVVEDEVAILAEGVDLAKIVRELRQLGFMPRLESSTVHAAGEDRYHLSLEPTEFYHVVAAVRLLSVISDKLGQDISDGTSQQLLSKLLPTGESLFQHEDRLETVARGYAKRFSEGLDKRVSDVEESLKSKVSRLVTKTMNNRGPAKHNYRGKSPASAFDDIYKMLEFAVEHELDVEIQYVKQNSQETVLVIQPKYFQGDKISARCPANDSEGIYAIRRVLSARLV